MKDKILEIMNSKNFVPMDIDKIYNELNLTSSKDFTTLAKTLNSLVDEKILTYNSKGEFAPLEYFNMAYGIIDVKEAGFAFLDTELGGIFIPPSKLKGAITYDEVMVKFRIDRLGRYEGEVIRIVKRNTTEIVGTLIFTKGKYIVKPVDSKLNVITYIDKNEIKNAKPDDIVKAKITKYFPNTTADGVIIEVLGNKNTPGLDITSLVISSNIQVDFSKETLEEINDIPDFIDSEDELNKNPNLVDLRDKKIITIDGIDAKDLDDAVRVEKLVNGNYLLGVYIADVTHYVKENSFLDFDAFNRGTSVYLPDRVIPMLPKKLSNGICSLNENVDRLVMACEAEINKDGNVVNYSIFEGIIKTKHRMNYDDVNKILEDEDMNLINKYQDIYEMLQDMQDLAKIRNNMRLKRGSFEFESLEPKLILNEKGKVERIDLRIQKTAENLIEEFMLCANETVAQAMTWLDVPFIYRVHEEPKDEKLTKLLYSLDQFGYTVKIKNKKALPKALQQILLDMKDESKSDEERTTDAIISKLMIRSMAKAKYQEQNIGHFGLASNCYTHFTSPIRRYPDLLVHRLIKEFMLGIKQTDASNNVSFYTDKVNKAGIVSSQTEKKAENLERNCVDLKKVEYMSDFIGKTFTGIISSITEFGLYIMLDNTVEGLVKYKEMHDDYYIVDTLKGSIKGEKNKKTYKIGDRVVVRLIDTNIEKRVIEFRLLRKE